MNAKCQTSCGFGVPLLASQPTPTDTSDPAEGPFKPVLKDRETMGHWASKMIDKDALQSYQAEWNADSLDGLPGLDVARRDRGERLWITGLRARGRRIAMQREALGWGFVFGVFAAWVWNVVVSLLSR